MTEEDKNKEVVIEILKEMKEAKTSEIIKLATKMADVCPDRLVGTLSDLQNAGIVKRSISKEKKGLDWSLI